MAGTNITNLLEIIQRKIDAADASTATQDLLYLLSAVRQGDGSALELYDSSGAFPDLTDSAADTEMIAYKGDSDRLYFNVGVWKGKSLPAAVPEPYTFQGSNFGYSSGGDVPGGSNVIDKFSFSADGNATDVGDLTVARTHVAGQSSTTHGYTSGGFPPSNVIDKFPFAVDANATDVGDLTVARRVIAGQSSSENGYSSGGNVSPTSINNNIDKFPFAVDANATDVGDLTLARGAIGQSSSENGYSSGGSAGPLGLNTNVIDKFPFVADANATDVGDLTVAKRGGGGGQSSTVSGYNTGGLTTPNFPGTNVIDKFPFAADANATDVGDLTVARATPNGQSSSTHGYSSGGQNSPSVFINIIDKFPFASDANATDVGDLTVARGVAAGQQY